MAPIRRPRLPYNTSEEALALRIGGETNALRLEARATINLDRLALEQNSIEQAALGIYGPPHAVLRNLIANLPNHDAHSIIATYVETINAGLPADTLLTTEHINVRSGLEDSRSALFSLGITTPLDADAMAEFKNIMHYALSHIDEGHLIVSMHTDRGMHTFQEILDFLPVFKNSGHRALTEGIL
jgi:hypothetical protein